MVFNVILFNLAAFLQFEGIDMNLIGPKSALKIHYV